MQYCTDVGSQGTCLCSADTWVPGTIILEIWGTSEMFVGASHKARPTSGMPKSNLVVSPVQEGQDYLLFLVGQDKDVQKPLQVTVLVDGCQLVMKVDTGASLILISQQTYWELWPRHPPTDSFSESPYILRRTCWSAG